MGGLVGVVPALLGVRRCPNKAGHDEVSGSSSPGRLAGLAGRRRSDLGGRELRFSLWGGMPRSG